MFAGCTAFAAERAGSENQNLEVPGSNTICSKFFLTYFFLISLNKAAFKSCSR